MFSGEFRDVPENVSLHLQARFEFNVKPMFRWFFFPFGIDWLTLFAPTTGDADGVPWYTKKPINLLSLFGCHFGTAICSIVWARTVAAFSWTARRTSFLLASMAVFISCSHVD